MNDPDEKADVVPLIVGLNLSGRRESLGLGVEQVAGRLGVSVRTLLAFEAGERCPDAKALMALAKILDVAPPYFFSIPKTLEASQRARLTHARPGIEEADSGAGMEVMRAFARTRSLVGRDVVLDLAQAVSLRGGGR